MNAKRKLAREIAKDIEASALVMVYHDMKRNNPKKWSYAVSKEFIEAMTNKILQTIEESGLDIH